MFHEHATTWGLFLGILGVGLVTGWAFERVVLRVLKVLVQSTKGDVDDFVLRSVHPAILIFVFVAVVLGGVKIFVDSFPAWFLESIRNLGFALVVALLAVFVARLLNGFVRFKASQEARWAPVASLTSRLGAATIYIVAFLVILDNYRIEITPLIASLGIGAIAIGLALQDTLSNFFAGVWMQTGSHNKPGHFVRVEEAKIEGYVVEVGWRTTKIRTLPNNIVVIPNSKMAQSIVTDFYLPSTRMSLLIPVSVHYDTDPDHVERVLIEEALEAAVETPGLLKEPAPFVRFIPGFGAYSLDFTLICQVREFVDQFLAQHVLRKRILRRFAKEGIRIPYPIRENIQRPGPPAPDPHETPDRPPAPDVSSD